MSEVKLTKKQLKAQQFRKTKEVKEVEAKAKEEEKAQEPVKKKRKTRRGRGGKGRSGARGGNRFIVFVGGLPRDTTPTELQTHFKNAAPDHIRVRNDKHIAFLEFDGDKDPSGIQRRMDVALLQHRTLMRDDKRINVELTVGGGGNSEERLNKLKTKNEKLDVERKTRMENIIKKAGTKTPAAATPAATVNGVHPDRAKLMK